MKIKIVLNVCFLITFFISLPFNVLAVTVYFKGGEEVRAEIIEETDEYITLDRKINGGTITVTYPKDKIVKIEEVKKTVVPKESKEVEEFKSLINSKTDRIKSFKATVVKREKLSDKVIRVESKVFYKKGKGFSVIGSLEGQEGESVTFLTRDYLFSLDHAGIMHEVRLDSIREEFKRYEVFIPNIQDFDLWQSCNLLKPFNYIRISGFKIIDWDAEDINGIPAYKIILEWEAKDPAVKKTKKIIAQLWLDKEYGIIRKLFVNQEKVGEVYYLEMTSLNVNTKIENEKFEIHEKELPIIDETYGILNRFENLKIRDVLSDEDVAEDFSKVWLSSPTLTELSPPPPIPFL